MDTNRGHPTLLQQVKTFLRANRTSPKKQLSQHFLINPEVLPIIVDAGEVTKTDVVIEIGAGLGCLTVVLADQAKTVIAIEVDTLLYKELESQFSTYTNTTILHEDILKLEFSALFTSDIKPKVIANLPYGITSPILWKLLENPNLFRNCVLMMQREVAERIVATPGGKDYGALTIGVSYYADTELICVLSPENFYPAPKVESALLKLTMREKPRVKVNDEEHFFRVVREAFRGRRKMLKNSLRRFASQERLNAVFEDLQIAPQRRAETLDIIEFANLAELLQTDI